MIKDTNDLIFILPILLLKSSDRTINKVMDKTKSLDSNFSTVNENTNEPIFYLSTATRIKIIDHLIKNQNFAILYSDTLSSEAKSNLMTENKNLIQELLNLPINASKETNRSAKNTNKIVDLITISSGEKEVDETDDDEEMDEAMNDDLNNLDLCTACRLRLKGILI